MNVNRPRAGPANERPAHRTAICMLLSSTLDIRQEHVTFLICSLLVFYLGSKGKRKGRSQSRGRVRGRGRQQPRVRGNVRADQQLLVGARGGVGGDAHAPAGIGAGGGGGGKGKANGGRHDNGRAGGAECNKRNHWALNRGPRPRPRAAGPARDTASGACGVARAGSGSPTAAEPPPPRPRARGRTRARGGGWVPVAWWPWAGRLWWAVGVPAPVPISAVRFRPARSATVILLVVRPFPHVALPVARHKPAGHSGTRIRNQTHGSHESPASRRRRHGMQIPCWNSLQGVSFFLCLEGVSFLERERGAKACRAAGTTTAGGAFCAETLLDGPKGLGRTTKHIAGRPKERAGEMNE